MRIDPRQFGMVVAPATGGARPSGNTFKLGDARQATGSGSARSAAPLATLGAILMLQEEEDPRERRRRSARRGQDILDALDGLKAALLSGSVAPDQLRRIVDGLSRASGSSGDPGLDVVIASIELRAKVELAKLGQV